MRPQPTMASVLPDSSVPMNLDRSHLPETQQHNNTIPRVSRDTSYWHSAQHTSDRGSGDAERDGSIHGSLPPKPHHGPPS
jgi:hypothetical protein